MCGHPLEGRRAEIFLPGDDGAKVDCAGKRRDPVRVTGQSAVSGGVRLRTHNVVGDSREVGADVINCTQKAGDSGHQEQHLFFGYYVGVFFKLKILFFFLLNTYLNFVTQSELFASLYLKI